MKLLIRFVLAASLAIVASLAPSLAAAAPPAVVEGVQMPAWVERAGSGAMLKIPLAPGMELKGGDEIRTGAGARVYVKMSEGSLVQLGENASLRLQEVAQDRGGVFRAVLNVLEGAFRFTTDVVGKDKRRDVRVTLRTVTAGIRGTDLWGKSTPDNEVVCLIEGSIQVGAQGEQPVTMDQSRQFFRRIKGQTQPVGFVEPEQLGQWARETAIATGEGAARRGGKWKVTLLTSDTQLAALQVYEQVRAAGYAAQIHPRKAGDKFIYEVRIPMLPSQPEAEALARQMRQRFGIADAKAAI